MVNRKPWARKAVRRVMRCVGCVKLPVVGLADVYVNDGKAWLLPGFGGAIRVEWFFFCRYLRRHGRRHNLKG